MRRPEHLAESLKDEIAEVVGFEMDDPRVEAATVTDVTVSSDLRDAKVYVLVRGTDNEIETALKTLSRASAFIRQRVAMDLDLRHAPELHFVRDTAEENAARVDELLSGIEFTEENDSEE